MSRIKLWLENCLFETVRLRTIDSIDTLSDEHFERFMASPELKRFLDSEDGRADNNMKEKEKHRIKKEKHVVPVAFNLNAMLRVLTLAASADGLSANDKRDILAVADQTDAVMEPHGGVHSKHPMIGDVDSARALVEGVVTLIDDFAKAHETDALLDAKAQKLIDAVQAQKWE